MDSQSLATMAEGGVLALGLLAKVALILLAACILARIARRGSAALRHGIWAVALAAALAVPLVAPWLPPLDPGLDLLSVPAPAEPSAGEAATGSADIPAATVASEIAYTRPPGAVTPAVSSKPASRSTGLSSFSWAGWAALMLAVWAAGALARLLWFGNQLRRVRWLSGRTAPEGDDPAVRLAEQIAAELGIRRQVCVLESSWSTMPLTWGVVRPIVLLPEEARSWPAERLRVVLLHELAHIRRWDYLSYLLAEIACAFYWPLPLVWLARGRIQREQEQACDDLVLTAGTTPLEYAEHLLAVARSFYGNRWELGAAVTMAREITLKNRIRTILDGSVDRRPAFAGYGLLILLLLPAFALPLAAVRPGGPESPAELADPAGVAADPMEWPTLPLVAGVPESSRDSAAAASTWIWLEAEDGRAGGPMEIREDLGASAGGYLVVPDGGGNDAPDGGEGQVTFTFSVPAPGEYMIWGRTLAANDNDNSFYLSVDGGEEIRWDVVDEDGRLVEEWDWVPLRSPGDGAERRDPLPLPLAAGVHTLRIRNREDGTRLDRILITGDGEYRPAGRGAAGYSPSYRWMEVEQARLEGAIRHTPDERASGGGSIAFARGGASEPSGIATFAFDVDTPGRYVVWGRVLAPDEGANSFYASLDGGEEVIWDAPEDELGSQAGRWIWSPLNARDYHGRRVDPLLLELQPGRHVLRLRTREPGIRLDGVLVTNDVAFRPRGIWPSALPSRPVQLWLEAESARLDTPFLLRSDPSASGGLHVEVEHREERWERPGERGSGAAILRFTVPKAGLYNVWARTRAGSGSQNSFWVRVNGGRWIRANEFPTDGSWRWSMVHDEDEGRELAQFELRPGENTLEFAAREGGARIDRVLVTDDPLTEPEQGAGGSF